MYGRRGEKNSTRRESTRATFVIYERVERGRESRLSPVFFPRFRARASRGRAENIPKPDVFVDS